MNRSTANQNFLNRSTANQNCVNSSTANQDIGETEAKSIPNTYMTVHYDLVYESGDIVLVVEYRFSTTTR